MSQSEDELGDDDASSIDFNDSVSQVLLGFFFSFGSLHMLLNFNQGSTRLKYNFI